MMLGLTTKSVLFFLVTWCHASIAIPSLIPPGNELIYHYKAVIKAGTHTPASYVSQSVLEGNLHVQTDGNATFFRFADLKHHLYNGVLDRVVEHTTKPMVVPSEIDQLTAPFKAIYDTDGKVLAVVLDANDKEFIRNIKRSIVSTFQMDVGKVMSNHQHPHHYAFVTEEHSIYGWGPVMYNVINHQEKDSKIVVEKMHDMKTQTHMFYHMFTNVEDRFTEETSAPALMHDSQRSYVITKEEGHQVLKHIVANGGVYLTAFGGHTDQQYVFVNQTCDLISVTPITAQQPSVMSNGMVEHSLTYQSVTKNVNAEDVTVEDVTNGRATVDITKLPEIVNQMLDDIIVYMHKNHIDSEVPNIMYGQLINRLQNVLMKFDYAHLMQMEQSLKHETPEKCVIFHKMLPLVGTKASSMVIIDMIQHNKVKPMVAVEILQNLAKHIQVPTMDYLNNMEVLINLPETMDWSVRKAGILAFSRIVYVVHKHHMKTMQVQQIGKYYDEEHIHNFHDQHQHPNMDVFDKYLMAYLDKVNTIKITKVQVVYMLGICNMALPTVIKHLTPAMMDYQWQSNPHLRVLALTAIAPVATEQSAYEVFWPILMDTEEHTEMRILAYKFLMETNPTVSLLYNIYWALVNEKNAEVYHFHYTYMQSLIDSVEPSNGRMRKIAGQLIGYMQPPSHGISKQWIQDFQNDKFQFSGGAKSFWIHTNHSQIFGLAAYNRYANIVNFDYEVYVVVHGLNEYVQKFIKLQPENVLKFVQELSAVHSMKPFFVEMILMKHEEIINVFYISNEDMTDALHLTQFFVKDNCEWHQDLLYITYEKYSKVVFMTDLGTPLLWEFLRPSVRQIKFSVQKEMANKMINLHIDGKFVNWIPASHGVTFYNVFADVWQGVKKYHTYNAVLPFSLGLTVNPQQQTVKMSIQRHQTGENTVKDMIGMRSHVTQMVFVKDDYQTLLKQSCNWCNPYELVKIKGDHSTNKVVIGNLDDVNTGMKYEIVGFDTNGPSASITNSFRKFVSTVFKQEVISKQSSPIGYVLTVWMYFIQSMKLMPRPANVGFMYKMSPSTIHPITSIDLTFRVNHESSTHEDMNTVKNVVFTPASKYSARITFAAKHNEQVMRTWDLNAVFDMNDGHMMNSWKVHLTKIVAGEKDFKVCVDGVKKWVSQKGTINGHISVAVGQSTDGKCPKDKTMFDVTMMGQRSVEQETPNSMYKTCNYVVPYSFKTTYHTLECLADVTTVRQYTYNVKSMNLQIDDFDQWIAKWWRMITGYYLQNYRQKPNKNEESVTGTMKVDVVYPMNDDVINVKVVTPQTIYELTDIPQKLWNFASFGQMTPDSVVYSKWFLLQHKMGLVDHCTVQCDYLQWNHHQIMDTVPNDWTTYVADNVQNAVFVKKITENTMAVKVMWKQQVLEVIPHGKTYQIVLDGTEIINNYFYGEWASFEIVPNIKMDGKTVVVNVPHFGVHLEFNGHYLNVVLPKMQKQYWHGKCYTL